MRSFFHIKNDTNYRLPLGKQLEYVKYGLHTNIGEYMKNKETLENNAVLYGKKKDGKTYLYVKIADVDFAINYQFYNRKLAYKVRKILEENNNVIE